MLVAVVAVPQLGAVLAEQVVAVQAALLTLLVIQEPLILAVGVVGLALPR
jgi:hypothetical protein